LNQAKELEAHLQTFRGQAKPVTREAAPDSYYR
jgi:hypothetical protein